MVKNSKYHVLCWITEKVTKGEIDKNGYVKGNQRMGNMED